LGQPLWVGELDPTSRRCRVDGREVDLTRREFDLLMTLMRAPNRVYRREELLGLVWGPNIYRRRPSTCMLRACGASSGRR
jgi:DNA-binding response OmpR family regulator